jgi:hypothetical protein
MSSHSESTSTQSTNILVEIGLGLLYFISFFGLIFLLVGNQNKAAGAHNGHNKVDFDKQYGIELWGKYAGKFCDADGKELKSDDACCDKKEACYEKGEAAHTEEAAAHHEF